MVPIHYLRYPSTEGLRYSSTPNSAMADGFTTEHFHIFRLSTFLIATSICLLGITLSSFSAFVYIKLPLHNTTNVFLTVLCFTDLFHLLFGLSRSLYNLVDLFTDAVYPQTQFVFNYTHIIASTLLRNFSICLHCAICAERFVAVVYPFRAKVVRIFHQPKLCLLLLCLIDFIYIVPYFVKLRYTPNVSTYRDPVTSLPNVNFSEFYKDNIAFFGSYEIAASMITVYIPFILTIIFTCLTAATIRNTWRTHRPYQGGTWKTGYYVKQRQRVTRIVVLSSFMFITLAFPTTLMKFASSMSPRTFSRAGSQRNVYLVCFLLGFICDLIGNTVNFFFYYTMSRSFRQTFKTSLWK